MKALEARVAALSPPPASPTAATTPPAAKSVAASPEIQVAGRQSHNAGVVGSSPATSGSKANFAPHGSAVLYDGQQKSRVPTADPSSDFMAESSRSAVLHAGESRDDTTGAVESRAVAPEAGVSRAVPDKKLVSSLAVPDLMTFSPAVGSRPPGPTHHHQILTTASMPPPAMLQQQAQPHGVALPVGTSTAVVQSQQPAVFTMLSSGAQQTAHLSGSPQESHPASPVPSGMSFYDNAVFGSPTPTPSPQSMLHDPSLSLLSPGSSPRPQQQQQQQQHPAAGLPGSRSVNAEASPAASTPGLSLHHNELWAQDTASISIPTTAAAAGSLSSRGGSNMAHALKGDHSEAGVLQPAMAPLPVVAGDRAQHVHFVGQTPTSQPAPASGRCFNARSYAHAVWD